MSNNTTKRYILLAERDMKKVENPFALRYDTYINGELNRIYTINLQNTKYEGLYRAWDINGNLICKFYHINGLLHGKLIYKLDGKIFQICYYRYDLLYGPHIDWNIKTREKNIYVVQ